MIRVAVGGPPGPITASFPCFGSLGRLRRLPAEAGSVKYAAGSGARAMGSSNNHTDIYDLAAFGEVRSSTINTYNPYRGACPGRSRRGGAWGYITDPSGMLQLGARFYWPEIGRFIQQDPIGDGTNLHAYGGNETVADIDSTGEVLPLAVGTCVPAHKGVITGMALAHTAAAGCYGCPCSQCLNRARPAWD